MKRNPSFYFSLPRHTRLAKLNAPDGAYTALTLAKADLVRLGLGDRISSEIPPPTLYHAVSQGALAVEVRSDDVEAIELCKRLTHRETLWECSAERACLRVLEGGFSVPVGAVCRLGLRVNLSGKRRSPHTDGMCH